MRLGVRHGVAWITLDRPAAGNRIDATLAADLEEAAATVEDDAGVRVVVLEAAGAVFSRGAADHSSAARAVAAVAGLTRPVVAVMGGEARDEGLALALACDLRLAGSGATFVLSAGARAALTGTGLVPRLARIVGPARAFELVLLGGRMNTRQAIACGLIARVVPQRRLAAGAAAAAEMLAARGPLALRLAKEAVVRALDLPLLDGIKLEEDLYVLLQTTRDRQEGIRAFLERRTPRFDGQ
ncbi:MAG: enoyl-CoA hydratase/isomerase family protein [Candidatus Binatia bacterium]